MTRSSLLLLLALLATGCQTTRYELRPPASETGRLCVTQCAAIRETCRGNALHRARLERDECEERAEQSHRSCLRRADSPETRKDCDKRRGTCYTSQNTNHCDDDHRQCFTGCGGTVVKIVEES